MERVICPKCGDEGVVTMGPFEGHGAYARSDCPKCRRWLKWLPKPAATPKRPAAHADLVAKHSKGYCELCLRSSTELGVGRGLEAHHVVEFQDGGDESRANLWIVCTSCHKLIHWMRTYVGKNEPVPNPGGPAERGAVGGVEAGPPW